MRDNLACVAANEEPFAGLALELNDVQRVLVRARITRTEVRCLRLNGEERGRDRNVAAGHQHLREETLDVDFNSGERRSDCCVERRKVIETLIQRKLVLHSSGVIQSNAGLRAS